MKGLSLTQPYATLVSIQAKKIETRSWKHPYRGPLAIHASKGFPKWAQALCFDEPYAAALARAGIDSLGGLDTPALLPLGAIVAVANLHRIGRIGRTPDGEPYVQGQDLPIRNPDEIAFGDYTPRRFGWVLTNVARLAVPIPCKGALGLWEVPADVESEIRRQGSA